MTALFFVVLAVTMLIVAVFNVFIARLLGPLREAMDATEAAYREADAANRAKSVFLASVSHEMRTPLNAIIGMTTIGKKARDLSQKNNAMGKIEEASSHLLGVINDVLDMAKIEADKLELAPVEYCFTHMLQKVVTVITYRVNEKRQTLTLDIDRDIPRFVEGDDQRLAQVIANLLSNAVKFTPEQGQITLSVALAGETEDGCELRVSVRDSGIGMTAEQQEKLFQAFAQADSDTSRKYGGTGLGLVISKRIVEMMGGRIWVDSELGKGARFTFTAKVGRSDKSMRSLLAPGVNWTNVRILVVDGDEATLEHFAELFGALEVTCDLFPDGEQALLAVEEREEYDICFIERRVPGLDGLELARRIKERYGARPSVVTMMTAEEWGEVQDDAAEAGVDKYLVKPLFSSSIIDSMNECLGVEGVDLRVEAKMGEFDGKTLLLADDIDINREILISLLDGSGIAIECATNGAEAVEMALATPGRYDIVFMDVQMPEMDGLEATRRIRLALGEAGGAPSGSRLPIVAMTANVFKTDIDGCIAAGMDDHIGKPIDIETVIEKLRRYLH
jgi:signal transduction histidine kinase/DNA-binding response OmpR family regulator